MLFMLVSVRSCLTNDLLIVSTSCLAGIATVALMLSSIVTLRKRTVSKLALKLLHVLAVVEGRTVGNSRVDTHALQFSRALAIEAIVLLRNRLRIDRLLRLNQSWIAIIELTTWAQIGQVVSVDVVHLEVRAASVGRQKAASILLLILVLLVEDKHFQEVLTVDELMLKLLLLEELSLKKRPFNVNIILDLIKLLFLEVKRRFFFKNLG